MRKIKNVITSLMLCIAIALSFSSCNTLFNSKSRPDGYTGGFKQEGYKQAAHFYGTNEIHWLETFEEAMEAIRHLKAAGNEIPYGVISSYENESVDAKYCFILKTYNSKRLKRGQEWYDRERLGNVEIRYYGFLDKVTIEELEYSYIGAYRAIGMRSKANAKIDLSGNVPVYFSCGSHSAFNHRWCKISCDNFENRFATLNYYNISPVEENMPENFYDDFLKTLALICDDM